MPEAAIAVVTGANSGIGKEIARQLLAAGLTVHIGARDADRCRAAVDELGDDARLLVLDVTDADSCAAAAAQVQTLDVLVNNAGINLGSETAPEAGVTMFRRTYETNVFGVVAVTTAFLPAVRRSTHPRVVNISSGTGSLALEHRPEPPVQPRHGRHQRRLPLVQDRGERADRLLRPGIGRRPHQGQRPRPQPARHEPDQRSSCQRQGPGRSGSGRRPPGAATR
jgi:NAD(P)-dependent dehydrogenase (short-subunit alcohol dehydrogenase family)